MTGRGARANSAVDEEEEEEYEYDNALRKLGKWKWTASEQ